MALFLQLSQRLTTSSNTVFRYLFGVDIGLITLSNNFVLFNRLSNLFARRPEMTPLLLAKIGPTERGMGHAKLSGSSVRHFVFLLDSRGGLPFLIGRCTHGQPSIYAEQSNHLHLMIIM